MIENKEERESTDEKEKQEEGAKRQDEGRAGRLRAREKRMGGERRVKQQERK